MNDAAQLVSKVLVLDADRASRATIRRFCDDNNLKGLRASEDNVLNVLASNIDLGGILVSERLGGDARGGIDLGLKIHALRPELPIFLRRESGDGLADLAQHEQKAFAAGYAIATIDGLKRVLQDCIFNMVYPNSLVRGITQITQSALQSQFRNLDVSIEAPYIVSDKLIFGELFTLIPIESSWCRGYMMLQTEEAALQWLVKGSHTYSDPSDGDDFRHLNMILGELTNLVWGAFKNRYASQLPGDGHLAQVPIVINHAHRYMSFGSTNPQLCFRCTLVDPTDAALRPVTILQRFVFNLNWSPEAFLESEVSVENLVDSGELELF